MSSDSEQGWISLYRCIREHWLWEDPQKFQCWIDLLLSANHTDRKIQINGKIYVITRGSLFTSEKKLSKKWKMTWRTVKKFLLLLESDGMILIKGHQVGTEITILNYNDYQSRDKNMNTTVGTEVSTTIGTAIDTTIDTTIGTEVSIQTIMNNNLNNENNENKDTEALHSQRKTITKKKTVLKFNPENKTKYLDWVYLSEEQFESVKLYYQNKGLSSEDFQEAVRELDAWFSNNQHMRDKRTDDSKALKGWPLDRALQRKANLQRLKN